MKKIRKIPCINSFLVNLEEPHFGPILGCFWPNNLKKKFFPKNVMLVNFMTICYCNFMK